MEIKTNPIIVHDKNGDEIICFNSKHTLADIVRWLMRNRSEAEDVLDMLKEELSKGSRRRVW